MKRNVLITGASSGIGKAIAYVFAANGDNIIITGRRLDKLEEIKQDIEKQYHVQVSVHSFDVTNMEQTIVNCQKNLRRSWTNSYFGKQCWPGIGIGQIPRL